MPGEEIVIKLLGEEMMNLKFCPAKSSFGKGAKGKIGSDVQRFRND